jgi:asparagine synthase (glutamine-hydrolysing)
MIAAPKGEAMCGIFGAVGEVDERVDVQPALSALAHRGPDAQWVWRAPHIVLAHVRLAVHDLSPTGAQPMLSDDETVAVVRTELTKMGHRFRSRSDTER